MSKWIRKGDTVLVISGNDRGKVGEVLSRGLDTVIISGVNLRKKHLKRTQQTQTAQIVEMEMPVHVSNVCLSDAKGEKIKVKVRVEKDGSRILVYNENGEEKLFRSTRKQTV
jgi:large subunit ribosomal protein L24